MAVDIREKLVELLMQLEDNLCDDCGREPVGCAVVAIADHLIANGVTVQEWISVKERLPEPMEWVLCACRANIIEVLRYDHIMDDWDTTMPNRGYMKGFVTHWMPLPPAPKGE